MVDTSLLNKNQKEAVLSDHKYLRIIAGAGSGKTRVLTMRIVHLIEDEDVRPWKILAITFTNKAAKEMKERIEHMVSVNDAPRWISTIHSLCVRILREDIGVMGYPKSFTIIDAEDQKSIVKEAIKQLKLEDEELTPSEVINYISNNKSAEVSVSQAFALANNYTTDKSKAKIYEYYVKRQQQLFALDFDDLILWTVHMFHEHKDVLEKWQKKFEYILVDEFQDIDNLQYKLIRYLVGKENCLYVVGDPDQTIYTWRGANVDIIMNFEKDFPGTKTIMLNENYRSTSSILNASNSVIQNNKNRLKKELYTSRESDDKVIHYAAESDEYEAAWIAGKIRELHAKGKKYSDMAILYRSNYLSRSLERSLMEALIPYIIYGGIRFYERQEIKDALCYLRLVASSEDDLALMRVLNRPKRGIGNKTMDLIADTSREENKSMFDVLKSEDIFSPKNKQKIQEFVSMIEGWRSLINENKIELPTLLETIIRESGLKAMYEADQEKKDERLQNLKALVSDMHSFVENYEEPTLDLYLQNISLYTDRESEEAKECVELMTVHAAKGLEFDTVFVSDLNDGIFPNERALNESSRGIEEERRLAYVAFTRAKNHLYLCEAGGYSFILQRMRNTSRFIKEIDEDFIEDALGSRQNTSNSFNHESGYTRNSFRDFVNRSNKVEPTHVVNTKIIEEVQRPSKEKFKKNDIVIHPTFGEGVIIKAKRDMLDIAFSSPYGIKKIAVFPGLKKKVTNHE